MSRTHRLTSPTRDLCHSKARRWILAYDISDKKRLQRVWRLLRKEGIYLQYSVVLLEGSRAQIELVLRDVRQLIDRRIDDVRVYPIGASTKIWGLGQQLTDTGVTFTDDLVDRLIKSQPLLLEEPAEID